ncbi:MAG: hypothetical protein HYY30_07125 [Chloroflexi bacterium]|nr:hypothetical protein [Chloroflexota bacterium]
MNRIRWITAALFVALGLFALSHLSAGAESNISVVSTSHVNKFPTNVTFALEANSDSDITKATLYYRIKGSPVLTYAYAKFDPATHIETEYVWNTQRKYIPPGVELIYYWMIEDAAGNRLKTEPSSFTIEDTRFEWQKQDGNNLTLYWYQGDARFANSLIDISNSGLDRVSRDIGLQLQEPVKIFIYASSKDLLGALEPKAQEWTGGRAFSELGIIALTVEPSQSGLAWAGLALPHELSHVAVNQATRNPYGGLPHWLDEGLAMYAEGPLEPEYQRPLDVAVRNDRLISLQSLSSNFPADPEQARLSYAESYSVVNFILSDNGRDKMTELLAVFKEGSTYDDALLAVFGVDMDGLEAQWRLSLGLQPEATPVPVAPTSQGAQDGAVRAEVEEKPQSGGICGGILAIVGAAGGILALGVRMANG